MRRFSEAHFGKFFLVVGAIAWSSFFSFFAYLLFIVCQPLITSYQAEKWPKHEAVVIFSTVRVGCTSGRRATSPSKARIGVRYEYEIEGRIYQGSSYSLVDEYCMDRAVAENVVAQLKKDSSVQIFVDPSNPSRSTVSIGGGRPAAFGMAALLMLFCVVLLLLLYVPFGGARFKRFMGLS